MGAKLQEISISVEVSPETATEDKLKLLRSHSIDRVSIGVQSFIDSEVLATQRRQSTTQVEATLTTITYSLLNRFSASWLIPPTPLLTSVLISLLITWSTSVFSICSNPSAPGM